MSLSRLASTTLYAWMLGRLPRYHPMICTARNDCEWYLLMQCKLQDSVRCLVWVKPDDQTAIFKQLRSLYTSNLMHFNVKLLACLLGLSGVAHIAHVAQSASSDLTQEDRHSVVTARLIHTPVWPRDIERPYAVPSPRSHHRYTSEPPALILIVPLGMCSPGVPQTVVACTSSIHLW